MGNEDRWSRELNDLGIATFTLDGFTPRGIIDTAADQSQLGNLTMINDAYRGLELLAKHPRIDGQRIGILGGSRGGRVALYASLRRFQRAYAPGSEFAIYLAFYTPCYARYIDDENVSDRPDPIVPRLGRRLRASGALSTLRRATPPTWKGCRSYRILRCVPSI